jgi:hypothetical protein
MGSGCIEPHFLDLGTNWRWVVIFTLQPLYPHWIRGLVGTRAGLDDVKRKFLILPGLELRQFGHPACSQSLYRPTTIMIIRCDPLNSNLACGTIFFLGLGRVIGSDLELILKEWVIWIFVKLYKWGIRSLYELQNSYSKNCYVGDNLPYQSEHAS